jgi:hypothetical protein
MERPTLNDPKEYNLIKSIYFKNDRPFDEDLDPIERIERLEAKQRNKNKSSR